MSILESLITNRTAADVARWRALRDKGFDAMSADEKRNGWRVCVGPSMPLTAIALQRRWFT